jgi:hypothetical protein
MYEYHHTNTKRFFAEFQRDPDAKRRLHREIKRLLDTDRPNSAPMGLLEPKPEPVDEVQTPHEFMYRRKGVFDEESA